MNTAYSFTASLQLRGPALCFHSFPCAFWVGQLLPTSHLPVWLFNELNNRIINTLETSICSRAALPTESTFLALSRSSPRTRPEGTPHSSHPNTRSAAKSRQLALRLEQLTSAPAPQSLPPGTRQGPAPQPGPPRRPLLPAGQLPAAARLRALRSPSTAGGPGTAERSLRRRQLCTHIHTDRRGTNVLPRRRRGNLQQKTPKYPRSSRRRRRLAIFPAAAASPGRQRIITAGRRRLRRGVGRGPAGAERNGVERGGGPASPQAAHAGLRGSAFAPELLSGAGSGGALPADRGQPAAGQIQAAPGQQVGSGRRSLAVGAGVCGSQAQRLPARLGAGGRLPDSAAWSFASPSCAGRPRAPSRPSEPVAVPTCQLSVAVCKCLHVSSRMLAAAE